MFSRVVNNIKSNVAAAIGRVNNAPVAASQFLTNQVQDRIDRNMQVVRNVANANSQALRAPVKYAGAALEGAVPSVNRNDLKFDKMNYSTGKPVSNSGAPKTTSGFGFGGTVNFGKNQPIPMVVWILGGVAVVATGFGIFAYLNKPSKRRR